jgi:hypothetical protein
MDSRGAPEWIRRDHSADQGFDLGVDRRPPVGRPESLVQYSRKRRRCHRRTVSGVTITRGCLNPAQTLASPTQKRRSVVRSLGRAAAPLNTASCWRRARFSRASWRWPAAQEREEPEQVEQEGDHRAGLSPDQSELINRLAADGVLAKGDHRAGIVSGRTRTVLAGNVGSAKRLSYAWSATPSPGLAHPAADEGLRCRHPGQWHEARPARRRHHARAAGGHPGEGRSEEVDGFWVV